MPMPITAQLCYNIIQSIPLIYDIGKIAKDILSTPDSFEVYDSTISKVSKLHNEFGLDESRAKNFFKTKEVKDAMLKYYENMDDRELHYAFTRNISILFGDNYTQENFDRFESTFFNSMSYEISQRGSLRECINYHTLQQILKILTSEKLIDDDFRRELIIHIKRENEENCAFRNQIISLATQIDDLGKENRSKYIELISQIIEVNKKTDVIMDIINIVKEDNSCRLSYYTFVNRAYEKFKCRDYANAEDLSLAACKSAKDNSGKIIDEAIIIYGRSILSRICNNFGDRKKNILLIGDIMLDRVFIGSKANTFAVDRHKVIADNIYMLKDKESETNTLGGTGYLSRAFSEIVGKVIMIGAIGKDCEGTIFKEICEGIRDYNGGTLKNKVERNIEFIPAKSDEIITTTKIYFFDENNNDRVVKGIRFDREDVQKIKDEYNTIKKQIIKNFISIIENQNSQANLGTNEFTVNCIVIDDYDKGIITGNVMKTICEVADKRNIDVYVDPKYDCSKFNSGNIKAIIPNRKECKAFFNTELPMQNSLKKFPNVNEFVIKVDNEGAYFFDGNKIRQHVKPYGEDKDASNIGCGTIFDAYFITSRLYGCSLEESVLLANYGAGLMITKPFGEVVTPHDIIENIANETDYFVKNKHILESVLKIK